MMSYSGALLHNCDWIWEGLHGKCAFWNVPSSNSTCNPTQTWVICEGGVTAPEKKP